MMTSSTSDQRLHQNGKSAGASAYALALVRLFASAGPPVQVARRDWPASLPRRASQWWGCLVRASALLLAVVVWPGTTQGQYKFQVLHNFGSGTDGAGPESSVVFDSQGNLYGTTSVGGSGSPCLYGCGTVFRLTSAQGGEWIETVLYSFCVLPDCADGAIPRGALAVDPSDNLYGTTSQGGGPNTYGTVFELSPSAGGWTETVLHGFGSNDGACCPSFGNAVIRDQRGNLYDVGGSVFEVSPGINGWRETIIHTFTPQNGDGSGPDSGPIMDSAGNLYGTTIAGGGSPKCPANYGCGTAYKLQPVRSSVWGEWRESILHVFGSSSTDGQKPGALTIDREGNLYGVTTQGGANLCIDVGCGTVYKLSPALDGGWTETIIYNFTAAASAPGGGVTFDQAGNLYGTTASGGGVGCGVIYKLTPASPTVDGEWQFTLMHSFDVADGCGPAGNLTFGADGNLYGTASTGGQYYGGVVFEITP